MEWKLEKAINIMMGRLGIVWCEQCNDWIDGKSYETNCLEDRHC